MTADLVNVVTDGNGDTIVMFLCPGCASVHAINTRLWTWNDSTTAPTFTPSVLVNRDRNHPTNPRCHSFVTDGQIRYLGDCTHELAGQTVTIPLWDERDQVVGHGG